MFSLGEQIIVQAVSNAYFVLTSTPIYINTIRQREGWESLQFICGSGLEYTITIFQLHLEADRIREILWTQVGIQ